MNFPLTHFLRQSFQQSWLIILPLMDTQSAMSYLNQREIAIKCILFFLGGQFTSWSSPEAQNKRKLLWLVSISDEPSFIGKDEREGERSKGSKKVPSPGANPSKRWKEKRALIGEKFHLPRNTHDEGVSCHVDFFSIHTGTDFFYSPLTSSGFEEVLPSKKNDKFAVWFFFKETFITNFKQKRYVL